MKRTYLFLLLLAVMAACQNEDNTALLIGKWQATSWTVGGKDAGRNASAVQFEFNVDGTYSASYEAQTEQGTFRLSGDKLYTTAEAENKIEKMVQLSTLTADTIIMDMNRVGDAERLTLVKMK